MGMEDLLGAALKMGGGQAGLMRAVTGLIGGGGLAALVSKLSDSGLGDAVGSRVGKGDNAPVSADQLKQALGDDTVRQVAQEAGVSEGRSRRRPRRASPEGGRPADPGRRSAGRGRPGGRVGKAEGPPRVNPTGVPRALTPVSPRLPRAAGLLRGGPPAR